MSMQSIGDAIRAVLNSSSWKARYVESKLRMDWQEIMGITIAKYTDTIKLIDKTLVIKTSIAPLKNELAYNKTTIIEKINQHFKEEIIKEIIIS
jgi:hypothetical protein